MNSRVKTSRINFVANPRPEDLAAKHERVHGMRNSRFINICHLMEALYGPNVYKADNYPKYEERCDAIQAWAEKHSVSYYAAPREDFSYAAANFIREKDGNQFCIVEDLS